MIFIFLPQSSAHAQIHASVLLEIFHMVFILECFFILDRRTISLSLSLLKTSWSLWINVNILTSQVCQHRPHRTHKRTTHQPQNTEIFQDDAEISHDESIRNPLMFDWWFFIYTHISLSRSDTHIHVPLMFEYCITAI